jgi:hypothetical protein
MNRGPHAVLAPLSRGYPPPSGRSPTSYSAVRHCHPKVAVRLACFRHAASVDPEPGSNSPSLIRAHASASPHPPASAFRLRSASARAPVVLLWVPRPTTLRLLRSATPAVPIRLTLIAFYEPAPGTDHLPHVSCGTLPLYQAIQMSVKSQVVENRASPPVSEWAPTVPQRRDDLALRRRIRQSKRD